MKLRLLWLGPVVWVALFVALYLALEGSAAHRVFVRAEIETVKVLAMLGCLAVAFAYRPGDYLRLAWLFMGTGTAIILVRDLTLLPWFEEMPGKDLVAGLLILAANLCVIASMAVFARTARISGLALPGTAGARLGVLAVAVLVAGALTGPTLFTHGRQVLGGSFEGLVAFSSALGDAVSFCLLAPVLLTAVSLRGGLIGQPWWMLVTSLVAWMFYDICFELSTYQVLSDDQIRPIAESFRALAFLYEFSAALAQRKIIKQVAGKP